MKIAAEVFSFYTCFDLKNVLGEWFFFIESVPVFCEANWTNAADILFDPKPKNYYKSILVHIKVYEEHCYNKNSPVDLYPLSYYQLNTKEQVEAVDVLEECRGEITLIMIIC